MLHATKAPQEDREKSELNRLDRLDSETDFQLITRKLKTIRLQNLVTFVDRKGDIVINRLAVNKWASLSDLSESEVCFMLNELIVTGRITTSSVCDAGIHSWLNTHLSDVAMEALWKDSSQSPTTKA